MIAEHGDQNGRRPVSIHWLRSTRRSDTVSGGVFRLRIQPHSHGDESTQRRVGVASRIHDFRSQAFLALPFPYGDAARVRRHQRLRQQLSEPLRCALRREVRIARAWLFDLQTAQDDALGAIHAHSPQRRAADCVPCRTLRPPWNGSGLALHRASPAMNPLPGQLVYHLGVESRVDRAGRHRQLDVVLVHSSPRPQPASSSSARSTCRPMPTVSTATPAGSLAPNDSRRFVGAAMSTLVSASSS